MALVQSDHTYRLGLDQVFSDAQQGQDAKWRTDGRDARIPVIHGIRHYTYCDDSLALLDDSLSKCMSRHTFHCEDVYGIRIYQGSWTLVL